MNRRELRELTRDRLADTRALLRAHRYSAAYYLAGYAVECGLKACIAKQVERHDFPDKKLANDSYTHDLTKLVGIAGLKNRLDAALSADKAFELNWHVVSEWSEAERYNSNISRDEARKLYGAITGRRSGVMAWLRNDW
jgi:HEPN domain-containing protein